MKCSIGQCKCSNVRGQCKDLNPTSSVGKLRVSVEILILRVTLYLLSHQTFNGL